MESKVIKQMQKHSIFHYEHQNATVNVESLEDGE